MCEQGRLGGCIVPGCLLRLCGQGSENVLVPTQLLVWARDRTGSGSWNQPRLQLRALWDRWVHVCMPVHTHAHMHHSLWASCPSWVPMHAGQSLAVHRLLSACTCLCILSYACMHTSSPGQPCLSTRVHVCVNTRAPPAACPVLLALRTTAAGWQRAAPLSLTVLGSSSLLLTTTHPTPASALLSSTMRRSWTCLTVPATPMHATANPTSKSMRMPAGASTPRGSRRASSARRMR